MCPDHFGYTSPRKKRHRSNTNRIGTPRQVDASSFWCFCQKPQKLLERIIAAKQQILSPEDIIEPDNVTTDARMLAEVYHSYQNLLSIQGLNDYEDLIFKVVRLLETDTKICQKYRNQFQHIFVDEYQDLNYGQYRIIKALAPPDASKRNLCVIGDPDQAIYGFRGSDVRYFTRFVDDYPDTAVIQLTRNYRSTETILDASFQVIQDHVPHRLRRHRHEDSVFDCRRGGLCCRLVRCHGLARKTQIHGPRTGLPAFNFG